MFKNIIFIIIGILLFVFTIYNIKVLSDLEKILIPFWGGFFVAYNVTSILNKKRK